MDEIKNIERLATACAKNPAHIDISDGIISKFITPEADRLMEFCCDNYELILRLCQLARGQEWVEFTTNFPDESGLYWHCNKRGQWEMVEVKLYFSGMAARSMSGREFCDGEHGMFGARIKSPDEHEPPTKPDAGGSYGF